MNFHVTNKDGLETRVIRHVQKKLKHIPESTLYYFLIPSLLIKSNVNVKGSNSHLSILRRFENKPPN